MKELKNLFIFGTVVILGLIFSIWLVTKPTTGRKPHGDGMRNLINYRLSDIANNTQTPLPPPPRRGGELQTELILRKHIDPDHLVDCRDPNNLYKDECTPMSGIFPPANKR